MNKSNPKLKSTAFELFQSWILESPLRWLAATWLLLFVSTVLFFAFLRGLIVSQVDWLEIILSSLLNQLSPQTADSVSQRILLHLQAFFALVLNGTFVSALAAKLLRHPSPVMFSDHVVYEANDHRFRLRWLSVAPGALGGVTVQITLQQPIGALRFTGRYGTQTSIVKWPNPGERYVLPWRVRAPMTDSNDGATEWPKFDADSIYLSPVHLGQTPIPLIRIVVSGMHETTGQAFIAKRDYVLSDVTCGGVFPVRNTPSNTDVGESKKQEIRGLFNSPREGKPEECFGCSHFSECPLGLALKAKQLQRSAIDRP